MRPPQALLAVALFLGVEVGASSVQPQSHEASAAPVERPVKCRSEGEPVDRLHFADATTRYSNLGGFGPDVGEPKELLINNVGTSAEGNALNLRVTADKTYSASDPSHSGIRGTERAQRVGVLNLGAPDSGVNSMSPEFIFTLIDSVTHETKALDDFDLTFFGLTQQPGGGRKCVSVPTSGRRPHKIEYALDSQSTLVLENRSDFTACAGQNIDEASYPGLDLQPDAPAPHHASRMVTLRVHHQGSIRVAPSINCAAGCAKEGSDFVFFLSRELPPMCNASGGAAAAAARLSRSWRSVLAPEPQADVAVAAVEPQAPRVNAVVQGSTVEGKAHKVPKVQVHKACADWCDTYQFNCSAFPGMSEDEMGAWSMRCTIPECAQCEACDAPKPPPTPEHLSNTCDAGHFLPSKKGRRTCADWCPVHRFWYGPLQGNATSWATRCQFGCCVGCDECADESETADPGLVTVSFVAAGSVSDYVDGFRLGLMRNVALLAGTPKSAVSVHITAASVRMAFCISTPDGDAAKRAAARLQDSLPERLAASGELGLQVETRPLVTLGGEPEMQSTCAECGAPRPAVDDAAHEDIGACAAWCPGHRVEEEKHDHHGHMLQATPTLT